MFEIYPSKLRLTCTNMLWHFSFTFFFYLFGPSGTSPGRTKHFNYGQISQRCTKLDNSNSLQFWQNFFKKTIFHTIFKWENTSTFLCFHWEAVINTYRGVMNTAVTIFCGVRSMYWQIYVCSKVIIGNFLTYKYLKMHCISICCYWHTLDVRVPLRNLKVTSTG